MNLKTALSLIAAAAVSLMSQGAFAQASAPDRAAVKAEVKAANKKGELTPAGEGSPKAKAEPKSTKDRAEVKADTKAANKKGEIAPAGEGSPKK